MEAFVFNRNILTLEIGDNVFDITVNSEFADKLNRLAAECEERAANADDKDPPSVFMAHIVDELLGRGACLQIFGTDTPDIYEAADVIAYICDKYGEFHRSMLSRYITQTNLKGGALF